MSWGNFVLDKGFDAAAAMTKFRFVKLTANETVGPVAAITDKPIGVGQFAVSAQDIVQGKGQTVRVIGVSEVECSAAVAIGAWVELGANGTVRTITGSSGARTVGMCVGSPTTGAGRISVLIFQGLGLN